MANTSSRRVGLPQSHHASTSVALLADVGVIARSYDIVKKKASPTWDFLWNVINEENREKSMSQIAFTFECSDVPFTSVSSPDTICITESALKVGSVASILVSSLISTYEFVKLNA